MMLLSQWQARGPSHGHSRRKTLIRTVRKSRRVRLAPPPSSSLATSLLSSEELQTAPSLTPSPPSASNKCLSSLELENLPSALSNLVEEATSTLSQVSSSIPSFSLANNDCLSSSGNLTSSTISPSNALSSGEEKVCSPTSAIAGPAEQVVQARSLLSLHPISRVLDLHPIPSRSPRIRCVWDRRPHLTQATFGDVCRDKVLSFAKLSHHSKALDDETKDRKFWIVEIALQGVPCDMLYHESSQHGSLSHCNTKRYGIRRFYYDDPKLVTWRKWSCTTPEERDRAMTKEVEFRHQKIGRVYVGERRFCGFMDCVKFSDIPGAMKRCSRCKASFYCSVEHQKAHWRSGHNSECKDVCD